MVRVTKLELNRTITDIMKKGDLGQLTTKKIRILCENKYKVDLSDRKDEIDKIVLAFIHKNFGVNKDKKIVKSGEESSSSGSGSGSGSASGSESESGSGSGSEEASSCSGSSSCSQSECSYSGEETKNKNKRAIQSSPKAIPKKMRILGKKPAAAAATKAAASVSSAKKPKKVQKPPTKPKPTAATSSAAKTSKESTAKQSEMDDAALARQLQAEEWNFRQKTVKKLFRNIPQKKSDGNEPAKKRKSSAFLKKCLLSADLAELLGTTEMSRPDIVQKMWSVVRERNLFDTSNKQYALCDEQLLKIFGKKRVRLIGMMKYLKHHVKDIAH